MEVSGLAEYRLSLLTSASQMFITDILFSSPRLHFSEAQKHAVLDWANELGAKNVPSLYAVNKCQKKIRNLVGASTERVVSPSGTVFYLNDIGNAIAKVSCFQCL